MDPDLQQLRRVLLVRNDRIGDLVLTLPAMEAVRRSLPHVHVTALVSPYAGPLLAGSQYVDELLVDDPADTPWQLGRRLKGLAFDAAVVFNTNTRNCVAAWLAGVPIRVHWAYKPVGFLFGNRRVFVHRSHPPIHESKFALALVRRLGVDTELAQLSPRLKIDPVAWQNVHQRIGKDLGTNGPLFGVHPGNLQSSFNWPAAHYIQLVRRLAKIGRVMLTGSFAEQTLLESIRAQVSNRERVGVYFDFKVSELAAALAGQTVLTVSSTGPMHLAGILGTPVVALFSPHPAHVPQKWAPLGSEHTLLVAPLAPGEDPYIPQEQGTTFMARIGVDQVFDANLRYVKRVCSAAAFDLSPAQGPHARQPSVDCHSDEVVLPHASLAAGISRSHRHA